MNIVKKLKATIPYRFHFLITHFSKVFSRERFTRTTFSADGEDLLLEKQLFGNRLTGFYVDVGSLHPKYVSNTHKLHKRGWTGINIDPNPTTKKLFDWYRKNDINLCMGVAPKEGKLTYFEFEFQGLNSFDPEYAKYRVEEKGNTIVKTSEIVCYPLSNILEKYLPAGTEIDLLDVDVEGFDLEVLKSNDWSKYKPKVIVVEDRYFRKELQSNKTYNYLLEQGYEFYAYHNITLIMVRKGFTSQ